VEGARGRDPHHAHVHPSGEPANQEQRRRRPETGSRFFRQVGKQLLTLQEGLLSISIFISVFSMGLDFDPSNLSGQGRSACSICLGF